MMNTQLVTNFEVPNNIGGKQCINDSKVIPGTHNAMILRIPPGNQFYNDLASKGMFLTKLNNNALTFRSSNGLDSFGGTFPELRVTYNQKTDSVDALLGMFRKVCENGMIGFSKQASIRFPRVMQHKIDNDRLLITMERGIDKMNHKIERMNKIFVSDSLRETALNNFYNNMISDGTIARVAGYRKMNRADIKKIYKESLTPESLIITHRDEDRDLSNAWSLYNTVQENITKNLANKFGKIELTTENLTLSSVMSRDLKITI